MPGCLAVSLLRPANNLFNPRGSSVVLLGASEASDSAADSASVSETSWAGSDTSCVAGASLGSGLAMGFLRARRGFVRRTTTGALA